MESAAVSSAALGSWLLRRMAAERLRSESSNWPRSASATMLTRWACQTTLGEASLERSTDSATGSASA